MGGPRAALRGRGAQPVIRVTSLFLGGAILQVQAPVPAGADMTLDLSHAALGNLTAAVRVAWCRPVKDLPTPLAAVAFHGSWDGLVTLRHQLAAYLGNRVFDGPRFVGYVLQEPNDIASSCFDVQTAKVGLIAPNGEVYCIRRRDAPVGSALEEAPTYIDAVGVALSLSKAPSLNVPVAPEPEPWPQPAQASRPDSAEEAILAMNTVVLRPDKVGISKDEEQEIFGMNTVVIGPDKVGISTEEEEEILGARTVVVKPDSGVLGADSAVLGAGGFGPKTRRSPHSKIFEGEEHLGFIAPSAAEGSWNVYGADGKKLALLASAGGSAIRVCVMGRKADESLVFLEAETPAEALRLAFDRYGLLRVDPALKGFD